MNLDFDFGRIMDGDDGGEESDVEMDYDKMLGKNEEENFTQQFKLTPLVQPLPAEPNHKAEPVPKTQVESIELYEVPIVEDVQHKVYEERRVRLKEVRKQVFLKLEALSFLDKILNMVSIKSLQFTSIFLMVFLTVAKNFGELRYLTPIFTILCILCFLLHRFVFPMIIHIRNDYRAGWNFSIDLGGTIVTQILFMIAGAFTFMIVQQNPSIHFKDSALTLIRNVLTWFAFVFFFLKMIHYITQFRAVVIIVKSAK